MKWSRLPLWLLIVVMFLLMGNAPAPYWACEGKAVGDPCTYGYYMGCSAPNGTCQIESPDCEDDPNSEINECLVCNTQ